MKFYPAKDMELDVVSRYCEQFAFALSPWQQLGGALVVWPGMLFLNSHGY